MAEEVKYDAVERPAHYLVGGMETIDVLRVKLTPVEYEGYLRGNAIKYLLRFGHKGKHEQWAEDARKSAWYATRLADFVDPPKSSMGEAS